MLAWIWDRGWTLGDKRRREREAGGEKTGKLVHLRLLQLWIPFIYAFCFNMLQCRFLWDCGSYRPCSMASIGWEATLLFLCRPGWGILEAERWLSRLWFAFSPVSDPFMESHSFWLIIIWYLGYLRVQLPLMRSYNGEISSLHHCNECGPHPVCTQVNHPPKA